ncbi:MAG: glycerate kinase [Dehalococcoidia bacterium]|nr:glycerate kinase [Dehalococcoidia bacterium]
MKILIAPQEFKGSLSADEAASAIAAGVGAMRPGWDVELLPLSDGGPGFVSALHTALGGDIRAALTHDPLGRKVVGRYLWVGGRGMVVVEAAQANGLFHLRTEERDALGADTFGVGELLAAAARDEPRTLLVGVGGSATTDGGAGMARALGARFFDASGQELGPGGGELLRLDRIEWEAPRWASQVPEIVVATDVTNPLTGPSGAAQVYGPQKGATPDDVTVLDRALARYAEVVRRDLGTDIAAVAGGGAAGGLAAGIVAFLGGRIESGFEVVAEATGLRERIAAADVVITGEGSFDAQSLQGKTTGRLLALATEVGRQVVVFAGRAHADNPGIRTLKELEGDERRAMTEAAPLLTELARRWAAGAG